MTDHDDGKRRQSNRDRRSAKKRKVPGGHGRVENFQTISGKRASTKWGWQRFRRKRKIQEQGPDGSTIVLSPGRLAQELVETSHLAQSVLQRSNEFISAASAFHRLTKTRRARRDDLDMNLTSPGHFQRTGKMVGHRSLLMSVDSLGRLGVPIVFFVVCACNLTVF